MDLWCNEEGWYSFPTQRLRQILKLKTCPSLNTVRTGRYSYHRKYKLTINASGKINYTLIGTVSAKKKDIASKTDLQAGPSPRRLGAPGITLIWCPYKPIF